MSKINSPWYTESITAPPLDHVPVTPTPRKYVTRGLKRGSIAALTAAAAVGLIMLFLFALVAIAVLSAFWWLLCRLFALIAHWRWLIVIAAAAYIAAIIFTAPH